MGHMSHSESHLVRPCHQNVKMLQTDTQTDIASTRPVGFASGKNTDANDDGAERSRLRSRQPPTLDPTRYYWLGALFPGCRKCIFTQSFNSADVAIIQSEGSQMPRGHQEDTKMSQQCRRAMLCGFPTEHPSRVKNCHSRSFLSADSTSATEAAAKMWGKRLILSLASQ